MLPMLPDFKYILEYILDPVGGCGEKGVE